MDQLPHSRPDGFSNNALYGESPQQFNASSYDTLLHSAGPDQSAYDNGWSVAAGNYELPTSRAPALQGWASPANANQGLHGHISNMNGQPSPYARPVSQSPSPYGQYGYGPGQNIRFQQSQPQYDPALFQASGAQNFSNNTANYQVSDAATIAPQALQHQNRTPTFGDRPAFSSHAPQQAPGAFPQDAVDQQKLAASIPQGADAGLFSIIDFDALSKATNTARMGNYANVGLEPVNWDCNRTTLPTYASRRSRNELRKAASNDPKLLAKIGKKSTKMQRIAAAPKSIHAANAASAHPSEKIRYEGESSSEDESSSDDDDQSSYTSDDEAESAPLPSKRPDGAVAGAEYDATKAVWRSKRKGLSGESIKKGLTDFWEIVKTIRDRWKADANAFDDARKKGQKSQFPTLESRVKDGRDMVEAAFKAALKHGHRSIVEIMSENESLIYICYQFLLDRIKAEDYNSTLPRTMLELMTMWTSLTEERMERTRAIKVLPRYSKHGDAKTKYYANKITSNAALASKQAKEKSTSGADPKQPAPAAGKPASPPDRHPEPVAGVKRAASIATGEGTAAKKVATGATKPTAAEVTAKQNGVAKKDAAKPATAAPATVTKTRSVTAKPSGIFSSLTAAKKPGASAANKSATGTSTASKLAERKPASAAPKSTFSFAETMASLAKPKEEKPAQPQPKPEKQLPPETPEEKAKRLRKESRRHLRVSFKRDDELTDVRYFTHDPDEELGHDASQMRDVSDVGGEGRMFKQQHQMMDIDEDEDMSEDHDKSLVPFKEPELIDFSDVDPEERARNYVHCGGGKLEVESKERASRDYYDANNLIVFYTTPDDIPPNPREPSNPYDGDTVESVRQVGAPDEKYAARARQKRSRLTAQQQHAGSATAAPQFDFTKLQGLVGQQPNMQQQQQAPASAPDISSILASLTQGVPNTQQHQSPQMGSFPNNNNFAPAPTLLAAQPQQAPQITPDLAALLQTLGSNTQQQQQQQQPGGGFGPAVGFGQPQQYGNRQQGGGGGNQQQRRPNNSSANHSKYKTKVCTYWLEGRCQYGEECSFKHTND